MLFDTLAIELKRRAPNAHTFLEVIKARYGTAPPILSLACILKVLPGYWLTTVTTSFFPKITYYSATFFVLFSLLAVSRQQS